MVLVMMIVMVVNFFSVGHSGACGTRIGFFLICQDVRRPLETPYTLEKYSNVGTSKVPSCFCECENPLKG